MVTAADWDSRPVPCLALQQGGAAAFYMQEQEAPAGAQNEPGKASSASARISLRFKNGALRGGGGCRAPCIAGTRPLIAGSMGASATPSFGEHGSQCIGTSTPTL